jgi:hypothetical protein
MIALLLSLLGVFGLAGAASSSPETVKANGNAPTEDDVFEVVEVLDPAPKERNTDTEETNVETEDTTVEPEDTTSEPEDTTSEETSEEEVPAPPSVSVSVVQEMEAGDDLSVITGRVTNIEFNDDTISGIKIINGPEHGNLTVNADNTLALVLSETGYTGAMNFSYEATYDDGSTEMFSTDLNVVAGPQAGGWGLGENYMLEIDGDGDLVVEHGDNHRDVYVSKSDAALKIEDIAALEGLDDEDITTGWLLDHPEYGGSETFALDAGIGMDVWYASTSGDKEPTSNWLHFEKGYDYQDTGRIIGQDSDGESELHPLFVTSWGEGDKPVLHEAFNIYQAHSENVVVSDIAIDDRVQVLNGGNILFDNLSVFNSEMNIQNVNNFTLRNSDISDATKEASVNSEEIWGPAPNRISGIFVTKSEGVLIENSLFDHNGWEDDYRWDLSTEGGQPPSLYSHNVYIQYSNDDVTFRDNIVMRGASFGAQIRTGGLIEDNVFVDNNGGFAVLGGDYKDRGPEGEYALVTDNLTTSAGHKTVDRSEGALSIGNVDQSELSTWLDNIVTHLADPNNREEELAEKYTSHDAYRVEDEQFYSNTIVYNWLGSQAFDNLENGNGIRNPDENVEGLDTAVLDATTIQNFAASVLGDPNATIDDLAVYLRGQYNGQIQGDVTADDILAYFQAGFGLTSAVDTSATTSTFAPDSLGEGMRWDNRLNWDNEYIPLDGQDIDLNGNWVYFSGTTHIGDLDFGDGGKLNISGGLFEVEDEVMVGDGGAEISIDGAGQFWTDGYSDSDTLVVDADGGRFANTGDFIGTAELYFQDNAQAILASDDSQFDLTADSTLTIVGDNTKVGFDGENGGIATLRLDEDSILKFNAENNALGSISEFRSGAFGDETNVSSGVHLGNAAISLDLTAIVGDYSKVLIEADELVGGFDSITTVGLGADRDANLTVDYDTDTVTINITSSGAGNFDYTVVGDPDPSGAEATAIWNALTENQGTYSDDVPDTEDDGEILFMDVV